MVFYGASGHCKVIIEAWLAAGGNVAGIFDDSPAVKSLMGFKVCGKYDPSLFPGMPLVISIGDNAVRKKIAGSLSCAVGKVVHPSATISPSATFGSGTVVMAGAIINAESSIGKHVILNTGAVVEHECKLNDFVHVSPNATLCGNVEVGEGTHIGAGAVVLPGIKIGKWTKIGAGSVVREHVPDYAVVVGVPGKVIKLNAEQE